MGFSVRVRSFLVIGLLMLFSFVGYGQQESPFVTLDGSVQGSYPISILQASDGNFYVVNSRGPDSSFNGTILQVTPVGNVTVLHTLNGTTDGSGFSGLLEGPDGNFYGVTSEGGDADCDCGTVFKLTPAGVYSVLHTFTGNYTTGVMDAGVPGMMIYASDGNLYGISSEGGAANQGAIYQIALPSGAYKVVAFFSNSDPHPEEPFLQGSSGLFYGTLALTDTFFNGQQGFYSATLAGSQTLLASNLSETLLFQSQLTEGSDGNFYSVSYTGGTAESSPVCNDGCGQVFKLSPSGVYTALYSFGTGQNGVGPDGGLFLASDGDFYGMALQGGNFAVGTSGGGTLFKISASGNLVPLYSFDGASDGGYPTSILQASDGNFYGTASAGGDTRNGYGDGVIFKLTPSTPLAGPVQLSASPASPTAGTAFTLSFNVSNAFSSTMQQCFAYLQNGKAGAGTWTGRQAGTLNGSTKLYSGSAKITPTTAGTYTYALTCGGIESGYATVNVLSAKGNTTTTVAATPNPVYANQNVSVSATVKKSSGSGTPTGNVEFSVEGDVLATVPLSGSGVASFTASTAGYKPGTYPLVATYEGDSEDNTSTSAAENVVLSAPAATTTKLTASPDPVTQPANCTLTATVGSSSGNPTGSVKFTANGETLATVALNANGVASLTASSSEVAKGTYPVVANYTGAAAFAKSNSSVVSVTVK